MEKGNIHSITQDLRFVGRGLFITSLIIAGIFFVVSGIPPLEYNLEHWGRQGLSPLYVIASLLFALGGVVLYFAFKAVYLICLQLDALIRTQEDS